MNDDHESHIATSVVGTLVFIAVAIIALMGALWGLLVWLG